MSCKRTDLLFYALSFAICAVSYLALHQNIALSLLPHKTAMEYLFHFDFVFVENVGYEQTNGLFVIARNCLGVKLFMSLFLIMVLGFLHQYATIKDKIRAFVKFYFSALFLALGITIIRISVSVPLCTWDRFQLVHNMISLVIYFASGLTVYFVMEKRVMRV